MKKHWVLASALLLTSAAFAQTGGESTARRLLHSNDPVQLLRQNSASRRAQAVNWAERHNLPIRFENENGGAVILAGIENGVPVYRGTLSANAAISTATDVVQQSPYSLDGSGFTVCVWDAGGALTTHQEFGSRVQVLDGADIDAHATYVTGIIGSAGIIPAAKGMAPDVSVDTYDFDDDTPEMLARAAGYAGEPGAAYVSNHSYGDLTGWEDGSYAGSYGKHFFSEWGASPPDEASWFGQYESTAALWDSICYLRPYFLPVKAISNDRDDPAPSNGQTFYRLEWNGVEYEWVSETYDSALHPAGDNIINGGYDTTPTFATAKNILSVGAINDAVASGTRDISAATMSGFSGWGPTDDGRIKPDLVGNGVVVYSTLSSSDSAYPGGPGFSGTSFSSPNVAGSAILLQEYYASLFAGDVMRASTLKGLILHTCDDLIDGAAQPGPDYSTGWGLMNTLAAAELIKAHADNPGDYHLSEMQLDTIATTGTLALTWNGSDPVRVTLCWTDPPGVEQAGFDDRTPVLVNDLDLRIIDPDGVTHFPYVLDVENPSAAATTGDNQVDTIEQVYIESPIAGNYTVQVSYKGILADALQNYSLIITGLVGSENSSVHHWEKNG